MGKIPDDDIVNVMMITSRDDLDFAAFGLFAVTKDDARGVAFVNDRPDCGLMELVEFDHDAHSGKPAQSSVLARIGMMTPKA